MSLATWGDVVFEVSADLVRTWQEMRRQGNARWARHEVHGSRPVKEFLGPNLDTLSMTVRLDAAFGVVPTDEMKALRAERDAGANHPLLVGGEFIFDCTLEGLSERHVRHDKDGQLLVAEVELSFEEYE